MSQLLVFASSKEQEQEQKQDLNVELTYVQPFRTPTLVFGKIINGNDNVEIICYSFGEQKNVFWGTYSIINDTLAIRNICRYTSIVVINNMLKERQYDGYILLSDVAKNKMKCVYEYHIHTALTQKKGFGFLSAIELLEYIKLIQDRLAKDDSLDESVTLFCKYYKFALYLFYLYTKDTKESTIIDETTKMHLSESIQGFAGLKVPRTSFLAMDDIIVNDNTLHSALNVSIATYKDINLRGIKVKDSHKVTIANKIIDKIESRAFLNKSHKEVQICPKYDECLKNPQCSDLCELYTNFML